MDGSLSSKHLDSYRMYMADVGSSPCALPPQKESRDKLPQGASVAAQGPQLELRGERPEASAPFPMATPREDWTLLDLLER